MAEIPPQPNFELIAQRLTSVGCELAKCQNLPAVTQGDAILQQLAQMQQTQTQMQTQMQQIQQTQAQMLAHMHQMQIQLQQMQTHMDAKFDLLERRLTVVDSNNLSRILNSTANRANSTLEPLATVDNPSIEGFPATLGELRHLTGNQVSPLLEAFGVDTRGSVAEQKDRFKRYIGIAHD